MEAMINLDDVEIRQAIDEYISTHYPVVVSDITYQLDNQKLSASVKVSFPKDKTKPKPMFSVRKKFEDSDFGSGLSALEYK